MLNNSRRSIFPEMDSEHQKDGYDTMHSSSHNHLQGVSYSPISNRLLLTHIQLEPGSGNKLSQTHLQYTLNVQQVQLVLRQIEDEYHQNRLENVKQSCRRYLKRLEKVNSEQKYVKFYTNSFKRWLGMTYLKNFQTNSTIQYLKKAKKYLKYHEPSQSAHKIAKRLNNLGLCELFLNQNANSFQYFSKALQIYQQDKGLNLLGLLKNITQLYRKWQMYDQAIKIYRQMLEVSNHSSKGLTESQEHNIIVLMLECSNLSQNQQPNRKLYFYRARDLIKKVKQREGSLYLNLKLRFELVNYGIKWGIAEGDCSQDYIDELIKNVQSYKPKQPKLMFLQASCYYIYRDLFAGEDWKTYRQYSECADNLFRKIYDP